MSSCSASSMPATSSNVTRLLSSPGATRRAVERPKAPSTPPPPPPPIWRRMSQMNSATSRIVGPKPRKMVASSERPSSGGSALTTTSSDSSTRVSPWVSTNDGTCVSNLLTRTALPFGGRNVARFLRLPWIVSACEEISSTLPASTCCRKKGEYGTCARSAGWLVKNDSARFSASSPTSTARKRRLRGIIGGLGFGGAPRPSGAGSTRQPGDLPSSPVEGGAGGGLVGAGSGIRPELQQPGDVGLKGRVADGRRLHADDRHALARGQ